MNFDLRKHVLEYDDVISKHRNKIYSQRREVLEKNYKELLDFIQGIIKEEIEKIITFHIREGGFDFEEILNEIKTIFPVPDQIHSEIKKISDQTELVNYLFGLSKIVFQKKEEKEGKENMEKILRFAYLRAIDIFWSEHLDTMDYLKDSVRLRAYGGRDPLVEYKTEGHKIFQQVQSALNSQVSRTVFKLSTKT